MKESRVHTLKFLFINRHDSKETGRVSIDKRPKDLTTKDKSYYQGEIQRTLDKKKARFSHFVIE